MGGSQSANFDKIRKQKREQRDITIAKSLQVLQRQADSLKISQTIIDKVTRLSVEQLVQMLNAHQITSKELTIIFCLRTAKVGNRLELITQVNFENALRMAQQRDHVRKTSKKSNWTFKAGSEGGNNAQMENFLPPLFGIPISVKDTFDMDGLSSSIGLTARANQLKKDGVFIKALKQAGLIPFVKSNIPQIGMAFDSFNFLWGRARNPWNQKRTTGGSSGGQAGLIAARCSPIGVGSDIGGSIRIPSQFCGVYGLKSTDSRIANSYQTNYALSFQGLDTLKVVIGPLSNSVQGLALWLKTITQQRIYKGQHDPYNKIIPFHDETYRRYQSNKEKLKVGYLKSFDLIQSTKASQRAVQQIINQIEALGHQAVQVQIPNQKHIIRSFFSQLSAEGGSQTIKKMAEGQDFIPQYKQILQVSQLNCIAIYLAKIYFNRVSPRIGFLLEGSSQKTVYQYTTHVGTVYEYRKQFIEFWRSNKLDFIVMPGFGCQASLHGFSDSINLAASYTFLWNILCMTVGSMPVTICKKEQQAYESVHNDQITQKLKQTGKDSAGLPVGVQIVGLPFEDQKVLGFMSCLSKRVQFHKKNPFPEC